MSLTVADIQQLDFSKSAGLLPAIVQDGLSGAVLMLGYMNEAALRATLERRRVVFWSRSKRRLWEKGESSGHTLLLESIATDCDRDTLLVTARPLGPACHLGSRTCFGDAPQSRAEALAFLAQLETIIAQRAIEAPQGSYTARLLAQGLQRVAQKVGEEGVEVALAGAAGADSAVIAESADLLFHLLVLLQARGLQFGAVVAELTARHARNIAPPPGGSAPA
jgi:phosphoribosyl-AMP cyclohydrolase / phosphoribosyl-ATP pyrophosphohydrolase